MVCKNSEYERRQIICIGLPFHWSEFRCLMGKPGVDGHIILRQIYPRGCFKFWELCWLLVGDTSAPR